jgi:hypothetical protein
MLIDDDNTAINLMPYSILKFGREDDELVKSNLTLNGVGGDSM